MKKNANKVEETRKCRKCGSIMNHIAGTNVFICTGIDEKGKECRQYSIRRPKEFNGKGTPCYMPRKRENQPKMAKQPS